MNKRIIAVLVIFVIAMTTGTMIALSARRSSAEMFPTPPLWYDVSPYGEMKVHYFEYKGQSCFIANTKYVVNMQCNKL